MRNPYKTLSAAMATGASPSRRQTVRPRRLASPAAILLAASVAFAGGTPENILLIVNPTDPDSLYLGNYYKNARNIPDRNILYMDPGAPDYAAFAGENGNIDALFGYLENTGIADTVHYIVIAPTDQFYVSASGYITDACFAVNRLAIGSAYVLAFSREMILAGGVPSTTANNYHSTSTTSFPAFDSTIRWAAGQPHPAGRQLYIGALLGYTGERGNTVSEIREMIDRSVQADGSRPTGTFYFMNTTDQARNVRSPQFNSVALAIHNHGGSFDIISGVLPIGHHDILGVATGWPNPDINNADMTILPGAFADHLTSFAARFDTGSQTKLSAWIRRGASASSGAVEEPCNYTGKFPHVILHYLSYRGMSLGEAWLRSSGFLPFQHLLVGDPMTRPFAWIPEVDPQLPTGTVSGQIALSPAASSPGGITISMVDMFVNGVRVQSAPAGTPFDLDTTALPDGHNEIRFIAYEGTQVRSAGSGSGAINIDNHGLAAHLSSSATSGNLTTRFTFDLSASPPPLAQDAELRLLHNGRIIAATDSPGPVHVHGRQLGAGASSVQLEAVFADGRRALSERIELEIERTAGAGSGQAPVAYSYTKEVLPGHAFVVELPGSFDDELAEAAWEIVSPPAQAVVGTVATGGPYRIMTSPASASGPDEFTFRITTPSGQSNIATVTLMHGTEQPCYANCDGSTSEPILTVDDFTCFINAFAEATTLPHQQQITHYANCDGSTTEPVLTVDDFTCFINQFAQGCP